MKVIFQFCLFNLVKQIVVYFLGSKLIPTCHPGRRWRPHKGHSEGREAQTTFFHKVWTWTAGKTWLNWIWAQKSESIKDQKKGTKLFALEEELQKMATHRYWIRRTNYEIMKKEHHGLTRTSGNVSTLRCVKIVRERKVAFSISSVLEWLLWHCSKLNKLESESDIFLCKAVYLNVRLPITTFP